MALGLAQPLTEMSTGNHPGGKGRPKRKADLTAICEQTVIKCGSVDVSQPYGPQLPVTGRALPFFTFYLLALLSTSMPRSSNGLFSSETPREIVSRTSRKSTNREKHVSLPKHRNVNIIVVNK
jgi:hypothetical protein